MARDPIAVATSLLIEGLGTIVVEFFDAVVIGEYERSVPR